jgi:hypothetical protein
LISNSNAGEAILGRKRPFESGRLHMKFEMTAMLLASIGHHNPAEISERIRDTPAATNALLREIISTTCRRLASPGQSARTARIERLLGSGALTETALALIDLELPLWRLRRVAYDGGEWFCALSRARELPDWLDQSVEAHHRDLALAILAAFVEAHDVSAAKGRPSVPIVRCEADLSHAQICDNFV